MPRRNSSAFRNYSTISGEPVEVEEEEEERDVPDIMFQGK